MRTSLAWIILPALLGVIPLQSQDEAPAAGHSSQQQTETAEASESDISIAAEINGEDKEYELLRRLNPDHLHEFLIERERLHLENPHVDWNGILGIIAVFSMPIIIVALVAFFSFRQKQVLHGTLSKMVEKGMEIPPQLLEPKKKTRGRRPNADLRYGIILCAIGFGVILVFMVNQKEGWSLGLIPLFIGVAYLLLWKLEGKPRPATEEKGLPD